MTLIREKNFESYFLVTADYCQFAKKHLNMLMGPSRGSSGGSLLAYLLDINELDPIQVRPDVRTIHDTGQKGISPEDVKFYNMVAHNNSRARRKFRGP